MRRLFSQLGLLAALALLLAACSGGPVRRVSEPAASIQQLTVRADGSWELQLRVQNYSSVAMNFGKAALDIDFDNGQAARVDTSMALEVGPESADVHTLSISPTAAGRARIASALADGRSLSYTLRGTLEAGPLDGKLRSYEIKRESALSPVPGLPGALR